MRRMSTIAWAPALALALAGLSAFADELPKLPTTYPSRPILPRWARPVRCREGCRRCPADPGSAAASNPDGSYAATPADALAASAGRRLRDQV